MTEYSVFTSYSRRDSEVVIPIVQILRAAGGGVFRDAESIPPGTRWRAVISNAIVECDTFLLFWCVHSSDSLEVRAEWDQALSLRKPVVPILLDQTPLVGELSEYHGVDMRGFLGDHREREEMVEESIPAIEGPSEKRRVRKRVLPRPPIGDLVMGSLVLWERLGSIVSGQPKPACGRYDLEMLGSIISGEPRTA